MLEKRKRFKKSQLLLKIRYIKRELKEKILNSLKRNHFNHYILRLSFTLQFNQTKQDYTKTLQKLICPFSLSQRVPNKHFSYSRFFLNKKLNSFNISNVYK